MCVGESAGKLWIGHDRAGNLGRYAYNLGLGTLCREQAQSCGSECGADLAPRPQKPRPASMRNPESSLWWRDSNQPASGKPGAVQSPEVLGGGCEVALAACASCRSRIITSTFLET